MELAVLFLLGVQVLLRVIPLLCQLLLYFILMQYRLLAQSLTLVLQLREDFIKLRLENCKDLVFI